MQHIHFYEILAQVVPVIFLASSLQSSYFLKSEKIKGPTQRYIYAASMSCILLSLVLTEIVALSAVYTGTDPNYVLGISAPPLVAVSCILIDFIAVVMGKFDDIWLYIFMATTVTTAVISIISSVANGVG